MKKEKVSKEMLKTLVEFLRMPESEEKIALRLPYINGLESLPDLAKKAEKYIKQKKQKTK